MGRMGVPPDWLTLRDVSQMALASPFSSRFGSADTA